jgi:hypothetical protein
VTLAAPPFVVLSHLVGTHQQHVEVALDPAIAARERTEHDDRVGRRIPASRLVGKALFHSLRSSRDRLDSVGNHVIAVPAIGVRLSVLLSVDESIVNHPTQD